MSPMREALYPLHDGRPHDHRQDLTPYSAVCSLEAFLSSSYTTRILSDSNHQVSSFNFPHSCDSTLITPVSLTQSLPVTTTSLVPTNLDLKLSPSDNVSPTYDMFHIENEFGDGKYNPPMKYKHPHGALHISTTDSPFPPSPVVPSTPYWGAYGVSATSISSTSDSSPSLTSLTSPVAPLQHSAGGQPTSGHSFGNHSVPLLIAPRVPSPNSRQPATSATSSSYRQNSLQSISTVASSASSNLTRCSQSQPPAARVAMPVRRRRKSSKHARDSEILLSGQMSHDENILMQLTEVERLPWKDVVVVFRERTGRSMKVPALQMRKKRLVERLRVRTPSDRFPASSIFRNVALPRIPANRSIGESSFACLPGPRQSEMGPGCTINDEAWWDREVVKGVDAKEVVRAASRTG
jgi:hypothetical protein